MLLTSLTFFLIQLTTLVISDIGLLSAKTESSEEYFCVSYVSTTLDLAQTKSQAKSTPLLLMSSSNACDTPSNPTVADDVQNSTVIVSWLGCSLLWKGTIIQSLGGVATIASVPSLSYDLSLPNNTEVSKVKIPLGLITEADESKLQDMGPNVMVKLYAPRNERFYFNFSLLIIWMLAMISVSLGASYNHIRLKIYNLASYYEKGSSQVSGTGFRESMLNEHPDPENVCDENDDTDYINNVTSSHTSVNRLLNTVDDVPPNNQQTDHLSSTPHSSESKMPCRWFWIVVNVLIFVGIVVLTYFFFGSFVYFFIGTYIILSTISVHWILMPVMHLIMSKSKCRFWRFNLSLPCTLARNINIDISQIMLFLMSLALAITWCVRRHDKSIWILQDFLSMIVSVAVISCQKITKLKICTLILVIFFIYDIFLVFITPFFTSDGKSVMEKLVLGEGDSHVPKESEEMPNIFKVPYLSFDPEAKCWEIYFILGLGDVIIPGLLFLLCFDFGQKIGTQRFYFPAALVGYGVGLILTDVFLTVTKIGQPALLYLVPCSLLCVIAVAIARKELAWLWHGQPQVTQNGKTYFEAPLKDHDGKQEC